MRFSVAFIIIFVAKFSFAQDYIPPLPYGGEQQLKEFLQQEMIYPEKALKENVEGIVSIAFIVAPNGKVTEFNIIKPVHPAIDSEAVRLFRMLCWEPGIYMGEPAHIKEEIDIPFKIKQYKKYCKKRGYKTPSYPYPKDSSFTIYSVKKLDTPAAPLLPGSVSLQRFIDGQIRYPKSAFKHNITGTVKMEFVVEPHGRDHEHPADTTARARLPGRSCACVKAAQMAACRKKWKSSTKQKAPRHNF